MTGHLERLVRLAEYGAARCRRQQDRDPSSREYGALFLPDKAFAEPAWDDACHGLLCLYYCPQSTFYRSECLLDDSLLMLRHLLRAQHSDGTLDLRETNFHDATAVAFTVRRLGLSHKLVRAFSAHTPQEQELERLLYDFLVRAGAGMRSGGFHTPNHRWVLASALSLVHTATGDAALRALAEQYLHEGIDMNADGDYTEQSVSVYDPICNESLLLLADELDKPELLEYVARNLRKLPCYWEPDGTVNTLNSRRQDAGRRVYPTNHYISCLVMAHKTGDPLFAAMAEQLLTRMERLGAGADFSRLLLDPGLRAPLAIGRVPTAYETFLPQSGLLRYRSGDATVTLLKGNPVFLQYQVGGNAVLMRLCGSFYAQGQFVADTLERTGTGYRLRYAARQGYRLPLPLEYDGPAEWKSMPHDRRGAVQQQDFEVVVSVSLDGARASITVDANCRDAQVPCKLELLFCPGGYFETEHTVTQALTGGSVLLREGTGRYVLDYEAVEVAGGEAYHFYTHSMRGSLPLPDDRFAVYTTFFTPHRCHLTLSPASIVPKLPPPEPVQAEKD